MSKEYPQKVSRKKRAKVLRASGYPKPIRELLEILFASIGIQLLVHLFHFWIEASAVLLGGSSVRNIFPKWAAIYEASFFIFFVAAMIGCVTWFQWLDRSVKKYLCG